MRRWLIPLLVLLMIPALTACRSIGERVTEEAAGLENLDVDEEEGTASFEVETEEGSTQVEVGGELPEDFSLPLPSEYEVQQVVEGEEEGSTILAVVISFPADEAPNLLEEVEEHLETEGYEVSRMQLAETMLTVHGEAPEENGRVIQFQVIVEEDAPEATGTYNIVTPTG